MTDVVPLFFYKKPISNIKLRTTLLDFKSEHLTSSKDLTFLKEMNLFL